MAQSLAREFGPKGVHVSNAIIDGVIDSPQGKSIKFPHPDAKLSPKGVNSYLSSMKNILGLTYILPYLKIADTYWFLHTQPRTSFTFEVDLRPCVEKW